jgi:NAD(P)-dependent dehydrogenase (short-subunit alcohol dehydrogenase family)
MEHWFEAGHVAIVTGGSRGLGKALARELLGRGLRIVIDGRDPAALAAAVAELRPLGDIAGIAGDVSDEAHLDALVAAAAERGRLDLLVNNASTLGEVPLPRVDALSHATLLRLFDVNVNAPILLVRRALPLLQRAELATIVNITSDAGVEAYPAWGGYGATKAALEHVSRVLAAELAETPVRVLVADPGDMDTQMHRDAIPDADPAELRDPADSARALLHAIAGMREPFERVRLSAIAVA